MIGRLLWLVPVQGDDRDYMKCDDTLQKIVCFELKTQEDQTTYYTTYYLGKPPSE